MSAHEPQAGFTEEEDDRIYRLHSILGLTFYSIQEQHFHERSVEDIERRFYEVRDARSYLGPGAQNQELQQQREHQSAALPSVAERHLDIEGTQNQQRQQLPLKYLAMRVSKPSGNVLRRLKNHVTNFLNGTLEYRIRVVQQGHAIAAHDSAKRKMGMRARDCDRILSGCSTCMKEGKTCRYTKTVREAESRKRKNTQEGNVRQGSDRHLGSQGLQQQGDEAFHSDSPPAPGNQQQAKRPRSMNVGREGTGVGSASQTTPVAQAPPRPGGPVTNARASASRPQQHRPQPRNSLPGDDISSRLHQPRRRRAPPAPLPLLNQPQQPTSLLTGQGIDTDHTVPRPSWERHSVLAQYAPGRGGHPAPPPLSNQAHESSSRPVSGVAAHETRVSMVELGHALPAASGPESHVMGGNRRGGSGRETERGRGRGHGRGRGRA